MRFQLNGTTEQQETLRQALAHCTYPFQSVRPDVSIPVKFADLISYGAYGLFWLDGRIEVEQTLTDPLQIAEVLLSEVAHAVDQYTLTEADHMRLQETWHPTGPDQHTWWDSGPYRTWEGECVDDETMALSQRGWVGPDDLNVGDEILTFDMETESTRWAFVEAVNIFDARPYRIWQHHSAEIAVTDNHRWVVRSRGPGRGPYRLVATTALSTGAEMLRAASASDGPVGAKWDDDFVELIAWTLTEGYYKPNQAYAPPLQAGEKRGGRRPGSGSIVITQAVHADRVEALLRRLGVTAARMSLGRTEDRYLPCSQWVFGGDLARQVKEVAPGKAPTTEWLRSLTTRQLKLFIDICVMGDGCEPAQDGRQDRRMFIQNRGPRLDAFLTACTLAGVPVSRAKVSGECETWTLRRTRHSDLRGFVPGPEQVGRVWCPTTSVGTFVARRGRSIFITGNSMMALFVTAFSDVPVTMVLEHKPTPEAVALLRSMAPMPAPEAEVDEFVGCRWSQVFHRRGAHWFTCGYLQWPSREAAIAAGRRPCAKCRP